jgi:xanthine dehydrogenase molybdenum-binding subunit
MSEYRIIGKRGTPREFGYAKTVGSAVFTRDVLLPGQIYAKSLRCPYAHAKIKSLDTSKAAGYPGVRGVLRYDDPEIIATGHHDILQGEAWREGAPVGVILAADTLQIAEEAVKLVEVEWEELPFYMDPEASVADGADILYPEDWPDANIYAPPWATAIPDSTARENPDLDAGFAEADVIIEEKLDYAKMYHAGSESRAYIFQWQGDQLHVWSNSQTPNTQGPNAQGDRLLIPRYIGIPSSNMKVHQVFNGGSFGGKISLEHSFVACALLAKKIGNVPVSYLQNRSDEQGREDAGVICNIKIGAKNDGTITAIHLNPAIVDVGDDGREGEGFIWLIVAGAKPPDMLLHDITCPNIKAVNKIALTSKSGATSFRCEKNQAMYILSKTIQLVASKIKMDPTEVALKNAWVGTNSLEEVVRIGKEAIGWDSKWHPDGTKTLANGKLHGMGFTFAHMWNAGPAEMGSMSISLDYDGSAQLLSNVPDIGVSAHTTYCMIAAEELGMKVSSIRMELSDTDCGFSLKTPGGSVGLATNSPIIKYVASRLKVKLLEKFSELFGVTAEELDLVDDVVFVKDDPSNKKTLAEIGAALGCEEFPITEATGAINIGTSQDEPFRCWQAHFAEVEVDPETGKVEVTNVVLVNDLGQMIRPESCEGQMYGGYYMAWGRSLSEDVIHDPTTGVRLNDNLCDYKYSLMCDSAIPTTLAEEIVKDVGPYGNVGAGEPTSVAALALLNTAVCNAVGANMPHSPVLPADILEALGKA